MPKLDGIDVSFHQEEIDWFTVAERQSALRFVMARMSHGGHGNDNLRKDKRSRRNRDGMRSAFPTTPRGFYHFLGSSEPVVQARHFRSVVGELLPGEFLMLDVEPDPPARVGELPVSHIVATMEAIEAEFGLMPWLYIGHPYTGSRDERLHRFPLCFPAYTNESRFRKFAADMLRPVMVWQWGGGDEGAFVEGITTGRVDSNQILDEEQFRSTLTPGLVATPTSPAGFAGLGTPGDPVGFAGLATPTPALQFLPEISRGDTGNPVFVLQTLLIEHGIFSDVDANRDGKFEGGTERGVVRFQQQRGLEQSGRVDNTTWNALAIT